MAKIHIEYSAERELDDELQVVIDNNPAFTPLNDEVKVRAVFVIRMDGDQVSKPGKEAVTLKKVPPEMAVFYKTPIKFILVVDHHYWLEAQPRQKHAALDRALSRIALEKDEAGVYKPKIRKWDLQDNVDNIQRYGVTTEAQVRFVEAAKMVPMLTRMVEGDLQKRAAQKARTPPEADAPPETPKAKSADKPNLTAAVAAAAAAKPAAKSPTKPKTAPAPAEETDAEPEPTRPARRPPPDPVPAEDDVEPD